MDDMTEVVSGIRGKVRKVPRDEWEPKAIQKQVDASREADAVFKKKIFEEKLKEAKQAEEDYMEYLGNAGTKESLLANVDELIEELKVYITEYSDMCRCKAEDRCGDIDEMAQHIKGAIIRAIEPREYIRAGLKPLK